MSALLEAMDGADSAYVLVRSGDLFSLTPGYAGRKVIAGPYDGEAEGRQLWLVNRKSTTNGRAGESPTQARPP